MRLLAFAVLSAALMVVDARIHTARNGYALDTFQIASEQLQMHYRELTGRVLGAVEIREGAIADGMLTLRMDGLLKVMKGITTLEQVIRETTA